jgi:hypothetical protein
MTSNLAEWFSSQLTTSAAAFAWAVAQVPPERQQREPPAGLGPWPAARHVFHLLFQERELALPTMGLWLGQAFDAGAAPDEDVAWDSQAAVSDLLDQFRQVRADQLALLAQLPDTAWTETRPTAWGAPTLPWVVTQTLQQTAEHTHHVLSLALYWEAAPTQPRVL